MAGELWVQETGVNATEGHGIGESDVYETDCRTLGELYRAMRREYGRCIGRVYVNQGTPIGWVFLSRQKYEDDPATYLREMWVTVHTAPDTVTRTPHYAKLPGGRP